MFRWFHLVCCWFGYHVIDENRMEEVYDEHYEETHQMRILAWCKHCGEGPFRIT